MMYRQQERTISLYGLRLKLDAGNLYFTDPKGHRRSIHVGALGDDLFDALDYAKRREEADRYGSWEAPAGLHVPHPTERDHYGLQQRRAEDE